MVDFLVVEDIGVGVLWFVVEFIGWGGCGGFDGYD